MKSRFSTDFSTIRSPNRVLTPLKSASFEIRIARSESHHAIIIYIVMLSTVRCSTKLGDELLGFKLWCSGHRRLFSLHLPEYGTLSRCVVRILFFGFFFQHGSLSDSS